MDDRAGFGECARCEKEGKKKFVVEGEVVVFIHFTYIRWVTYNNDSH